MSPPDPNTMIQETAPQAGAPGSSAAASEREVKISIRDLDFHYGSHHALKSISVDIFAREVTALIGPSGCGKSTFLRCLNRMNELLPATRTGGKIELDGQSIYGRSVDVVELRKQVGMVFQKPNPFPMSIWENIAAGPRIHGTKKRGDLDDIVEQSLRRAALWDEVKDDLRKGALNLSGGQQQRLCIARALAINPQVILMDEPCSALDPISTYKIEQLIEELREQYTIIIVTHNMHQASRVSQRTGFFLLGELIEVGPTGQLFEAPSDQRTDDYIRGRMG